MELVILIGLQASGKSSFRRVRLATLVCVSKDDWPNARRREDRQRRLVAEALSDGRSVVVDNTNPCRADRAPLIALGREAGAEVVGFFFEPVWAESRARNAMRGGRAYVPEVALRRTFRELEVPSLAEGFTRLSRVRLTESGFEVAPWPIPEEQYATR